MTGNATSTIGGVRTEIASPPEIVDVWSRTAPKYRVRAVVLLLVNVVLFAGVGSFAYWLRSGIRFAPAMDGYGDELREAMRFTGDTGITLGSLLLEPISVLDVPMQIPIHGLLMATLVAIPILVSILYRFWSSIPFLLVVALLAVMPWLALTLAVSCVIASARPFRARLRFISALAGLAPIVLYFVLAWRGSAEQIVGRIDPVDRVRFVAPWVLAMVAAGALFAVVLTIARIVNYRPGAITPLLAIMFATPAALFEFHVGRDELYYRLLDSRFRGTFADVDASLPLEEAVRRAWERHSPPRPSLDEVRQSVEVKWLFELASDFRPHGTELTRAQEDIIGRCDDFRLHFPDSRHAVNVLFIQARTRDLRVDIAEFQRSKWIRFYDDFPSPASRDTWQLLTETAPETTPAAVGALRLAQLEVRDGHVDRALALLDRALLWLDDQASQPAVSSESGVLTAFTRSAADAGLDISVDVIALQARRLRDLVAANADPLYGYEPLTGSLDRNDDWPFGLVDLDPRDASYGGNLRRLMAKYPNAQITDNALVAQALVEASVPARMPLFRAVVERFPEGDAAPEALYHLAMALRDLGNPDAAAEAFGRLRREFPETIWSRLSFRYAAPLRHAALGEGRT